jgi:uncharacterized protein
MDIIKTIAAELKVNPRQVQATIALLQEGATVPFIARYRKEVTGSLDDTQLRQLQERWGYLCELEERRGVILNSIKEQDKLTPDLEGKINAAETKTVLEDLYAPYKPKRRTKAQIAREAGLEPLAHALLNDPALVPEVVAQDYLNEEKQILDVKSALEGARQILMEQFAEDAQLVGDLREYVWQNACLHATVIEEKKEEGAKFADYFAFSQAIQQIPSHRALALLRGRKEGILALQLKLNTDSENVNPQTLNPCEVKIASHFKLINKQRPADTWLEETVRWTWRIKLSLHLETELMLRLRESAEAEAIKVFANNLHDLLLAAPAGAKTTMGLDPGLRTGVKVAIVDQTGKLLDKATIYPHAPKNDWQGSLKVLAKLCQQYQVELISIGNGTASRETDKLVLELIKHHSELKLNKIVVSEAGASVYSASELAAKEFPDLDVTFRGAVSIARRLQDPLAELVKIEPKAIGVGQYQHDVNQIKLAQSLNAMVEDCVNAVGVDVNMASVPLLTRISGLNETLAKNIVDFRNQFGAFTTREVLKKVPRLGDKAFEQAAGFLRIVNGTNPLDASAVHPEAYPIVEKILLKNNMHMQTVIGNAEFLQKLNASEYSDERFGLPTVKDILSELEKPGRDPRPEFKTATFKEGVESLSDLEVGMILEGVITNVTNFGAFVDIGVHQDGLVHISELSNTFVKDPRSVVKAGMLVQVKVMEVDIKRKRVSLSMRLETSPEIKAKQSIVEKKENKPAAKKIKSMKAVSNNTSAFGEALLQVLKEK